jgi:hypothetical protein
MTDRTKPSAETPKPAPTKETARERAERARRENPELFEEAPKTGKGFIIGGAKAAESPAQVVLRSVAANQDKVLDDLLKAHPTFAREEAEKMLK